MKKIIKKLKTNIILIIPLIIGLLIPIIGVGAATKYYNSDEVAYNHADLKKNNVLVTNVKDALDVLYQRALDKVASGGGGGGASCTTPSFNPGFKPGDYVDMVPWTTTSTTISTLSGVSGYVTPSQLSVWRVIRVNEDCTVEMVSEYVSDTNVTLNGKDGYKNMVYGLNEYAKLYANKIFTLDPETAPTGAFRNMGYDGQTLQITDESRITNSSLGASGGAWYQKTTSLNGEESLGGGDQGFATDVKLLTDAGISLVAYQYNTTTPTIYWLASRLFSWGDASWYFSTRIMNNSGNIAAGNLYYRNGSKFNTYSSSFALRPIVTLRSGITPTGGNGTSSSHYTLY